jgi:hypothetical protein
MTPASLFEELAEILGKETEAHRRLLAAAREMNQAAKSGDILGLKRFTSEIDGEIHRIEQLEEDRKSRCALLVSATGLPDGNPRMAQLIARAPDLIRARLSGLRTALKEHLTAIASINGANRLLCDEGVRIAREQLQLIMQPPVKFANYHEGGTRTVPGISFNTLINRTA